SLFFTLRAVSALLAVGSKENAIMLPVSLYLFDLLLIQGINNENLSKNIKYIVLPAIVVLVFLALFTDISSIAGNYSIRPFSMWERLLTEPRVIIFYITLLLYPTYSRLMLNHDFVISSSMLDPWTTLPAILIILFCLALAVAVARRKPLISFCIIFFFLNHLIEGSFISLDIVYEHRNYIPSMLFFVPLSLFIVSALDFFSYRRSMQFIIILLVSFVIAAQGHTVKMYNYIFNDPYILWSDNVEKAPNLSRPHNNLGDTLWAMGLYDDAYQSYEKAYQLNRFSVLTMVAAPLSNMGGYYYLHKNYTEALKNYEAALKIKPGYPPTWMNIARTRIRMTDLKGAEETIQKALSKWPANAELYAILGFIRLKQGEFDDALKKAWKTLAIDGGFIDIKRVMAEAYRRKGFYERSVSCWEQYMAGYRNDLEGHLALIDLYSKTGQTEKLDRTIARVMVLKGSKSWSDLINEYNGEHAAHAYVPDKRALLSIVRKNLLKDF
ncbi:MAG: tetratricopeptide repeat protein, partial [Desulfobacterales bacterium]|nr:tetratricopeptide repeat protein [Desulfobacterales bacterium]